MTTTEKANKNPATREHRNVVEIKKKYRISIVIPPCGCGLLRNASHHRQPKAERGTSGALGCPSACDCYVTFTIPLH